MQSEESITSRDEQIDAIIMKIHPLREGWVRCIRRGGVLCNGTVTYSTHNEEFELNINVFLDFSREHGGRDIRSRVSGFVTEKLPGDTQYFGFDGCYTRTYDSFDETLAEIERICAQRRAMPDCERKC